MKKKSITIRASILEILIGIVIVFASLSADEPTYWGGMGFALIFMGIFQMVRRIKYKNNESYREAVDVEVNDERNRYLGTKAWASAGYIYVVAAGVASIVLKLMGKDELSVAAGLSVLLIALFYWLSYLYLRKKY